MVSVGTPHCEEHRTSRIPQRLMSAPRARATVEMQYRAARHIASGQRGVTSAKTIHGVLRRPDHGGGMARSSSSPALPTRWKGSVGSLSVGSGQRKSSVINRPGTANAAPQNNPKRLSNKITKESNFLRFDARRKPISRPKSATVNSNVYAERFAHAYLVQDSREVAAELS